MVLASRDQLDHVFAALADPTRRAILARLANGEATVNELVAPFELSQPTISKHLKVLERAGLASRGRDAQFRPVLLNAEPLASAARWLGDYRRFWAESLDQLDEYVRDLNERRNVMQASKGGDESTADREVVITRVFEAAARLLFEAYSKPEHIRKWFGPKGWPITLCEMDFRKAGRFRFAMTGADGQQGPPFGGEYLEIIPNRKIVYDNAFEMPGAEKMIVTITFDEKDGKTTLTVHTLFASVAMKNEHVGWGYARGVNGGLDQLADIVAEMRASTAFEKALATASTVAPARAARRDLARKIVVSEFVSLDGVMEAPGGEPGHPHTGWVRDFMSAEQIDYKLAEVLEAESLLIGRVTYETFAASWPKRSGELADKMNAMPKHVVSTSLRDPEWNNSRVINRNVAEEVTRLKKQADGPILVVGSRSVVHLLMDHDLVDEYRVMIFPVALGGGQRLFPETPRKTVLRLVDSRTFSSGVVVHTYHPASA